MLNLQLVDPILFDVPAEIVKARDVAKLRDRHPTAQRTKKRDLQKFQNCAVRQTQMRSNFVWWWRDWTRIIAMSDSIRSTTGYRSARSMRSCSRSDKWSWTVWWSSRVCFCFWNWLSGATYEWSSRWNTDWVVFRERSRSCWTDW